MDEPLNAPRGVQGPEGLEDWGCFGWVIVGFAVFCGIATACAGGGMRNPMTVAWGVLQLAVTHE